MTTESGANRLIRWAVHHDESWLFVAIYLGLAVGLSVFVSLFWLLVCGVFHLLLELVRQAHYRDSVGSVLLHAFWEIKMDVGLILLALSLVLYLEVVLGVLGLQSAARAAAVGRAANTGVRAGTRAAQAGSRAAQAGARAAGGSSSAMEQWVRGFLLTVDELARVVYAIFLVKEWKKKSATPATGGAALIDAAAEPPLEQAAAADFEVDNAAGDTGDTRVEARAETTAIPGETRDTSANAEPEDFDGVEEDSAVNTAVEETAESAVADDDAHVYAVAPDCEATPSLGAEETAEAEEPREPDQPLQPEAHGADDSAQQAARTPPDAARHGSWAVSDLIGVFLVVVAILLLAAAPYFTAHEWETAAMTIAEELRPLSGLE